MKQAANGEDIAALVRPTEVHRRVYTDPAIFELEMARIFGRTWLYIGHESQVARPGDFYTTRMGRQTVVVTRHEDGEIYVLYNRCGHRGSQVVSEERGNAQHFRCCYHGWTFRTNGDLHSVPLKHGFPAELDFSRPDLGMVRVPRVATYRGFVFASLAPDGPDLTDFLGYAATSFDDMVDRAPQGEIEVAGGVFKHAYNANWKLYLENLLDAAHPFYVHQSSIAAARAQSDDVASDGAGEIAVRQMRQNGAPYAFWEKQVGLWTYPNGHAFMGDYHDDEKLVAAKNDPAFADYRAAMEAAYGSARTDEILSVARWNTNVYPNCSFMGQFRQLRVVHPIAVDHTVVYTYSFRLKGAPAAMFADTVHFANIVNGTASPVLTDDLETYDRIGAGMRSQGADWIQIARCYGTDRPNNHGGLDATNGTSEVFIRNMFAAWRDYMSAQS